MTKYRVVTDAEYGYAPQFKKWYFPVCITFFAESFTTVQGAEDVCKRHRNKGKLIKTINP